MFSRQIEVIGKKKQEMLKNRCVGIIGAGGLGTHLLLTLSCIGLGKIFVVDSDRIEKSNLHRQPLFTIDDIGKFKSEVAVERANRCGDTILVPIVGKFEEVKEKLRGVDLIFDATDNFATRFEIDKFAKELGISWILGAVEEFRGQVGLFRESPISEFFSGNYTPPPGQFPPFVALVGAIEANLGIKELIEGPRPEELLYLEWGEKLIIEEFRLLR
jgi:molybdopterin/thiamine biosynthesis adenylyltransferase